MPPRARADFDTIARTAAAQQRCLTLAQLAAAGMGPGSVSHRTRPDGGCWTRLLPGIVVLHRGTPTADERAAAALLYAGEGAVLTGAEALRRIGLHPRSPDARVHVLIPADRRRASASFAVCERTRELPRPSADRAGFPVAPVGRALVDAARLVGSLGDTRAVVAEAVQRRLVRDHELAAEIRRGQRRRTAGIRLVAAEIIDGVRSAAEADFRSLVHGAGLRPVWNHDLLTDDGEFVACPDAWFDDYGLAVEVESRRWHATPEGWERSQRKLATYAAHGISVLPVLPSRVRDEPGTVLRDLRLALDAAAGRPRPAVRAVLRSQAA